MVKETQYYDFLGVSQDADTSTIVKAFRKEAAKYHPDKTQHLPEKERQEAEEKFKKLSHIKDILTDERKRRIYDQVGEAGLSGNAGEEMDPFAAMGGLFGGFPGFPGFSFMGDMPGMPGMSGMNDGRQQNQRQQILHKISLQDVFKKEPIVIKYPKNLRCDTCEGTGCKDKKKRKCQKCNGRGISIEVRQIGNTIQQIHGQCRDCNGTGKDMKQPGCEKCDREGVKHTEASTTISLGGNVSNGMKILNRGEGSYNEGKYIDLEITVEIEENDQFEIKGSNLIASITLTPGQAFCGFNKVISHPSGIKFNISGVPGKVVQDGTYKIIPSMGLPSDGALIVAFVVNEIAQFEEKPNEALTFTNLKKLLGGGKDDPLKGDIVYKVHELKDLNQSHLHEQRGHHGEPNQEEYMRFFMNGFH
jgi:DnaJ-class molecular chaperone